MKSKIFFIIIFLSAINISAQNYDWARYDSLVTAGIKQIYGIKFEQAESTFSIVDKEFATHPAGKFFKAMITWWRILLDLENEKLDDKFYDQLEEVIDFCDDILDKNPKNSDAMFFKGGALGFRGRLLAIRESWFKAALDGKDALPLVFKAYELNPQNTDVQLGFGIYNYYAEVIPQKYPVVKPFMVFFPKGDKNKGLKQLENVAYNGRYAKIESRYFLMTLYFQFEENPDETLKYAKLLLKDFPDNPMFEKYYGLVYVRQNDYINAAKIFGGILNKCDNNFPGYNKKFKREASYYLGMKYFLKNVPDSAITYFSMSEKLSRELDKDAESGFQINTVLYLGMMNDLVGNRKEAVRYYNESLDLKERGDSHKQAEAYLKTPYKR